jgi:holo-[acyl-carrier protein] synthase
MIYGIGVDLVSIKRIERIIERWQERFLRRVYTFQETETCNQRPFPAAAFALRFAAKEALSKALGLGMRKGLRWREIEVCNQRSGKPFLRLSGKSAEICRQNKIVRSHLSLSDEDAFGVAMVVLEKEE